MLKGRRCYCNRMYPGFRCAYCRLNDILTDEERQDPVEQGKLERRKLNEAVAEPTTWWGRLSAYGKSALWGRRTER